MRRRLTAQVFALKARQGLRQPPRPATASIALGFGDEGLTPLFRPCRVKAGVSKRSEGPIRQEAVLMAVRGADDAPPSIQFETLISLCNGARRNQREHRADSQRLSMAPQLQ
jgi:hypothetical protein